MLMVLVLLPGQTLGIGEYSPIDRATNANPASTRLSSHFKKGYPHGLATLQYPNTTTAWAGRVCNGLPAQEGAPHHVQQIFTVFAQHPFRSEIKIQSS